jgi:putative membrane-bound dehydrogenase-like protein
MFSRSVLRVAGLLGFWSSAMAAEVQLNGQTFTLPNDLEIQLVTTPRMVQRPISASFDEEGRLYVTDSSGSNDPVEKQVAEKTHRVVRLEDTDGDGVFDRSVVFADDLMFPEGALWLRDSLYVSAPPSIWKLTDTDRDFRADARSEWYQGVTLGHCANDLHGPYLGPEGWLYWCKGGFEQQTHARPGRTPLKDRAAHIFRARVDGSGFEPVMSGGMDNPVEVVFTPEGEPIFTSTFLDLSGAGKRDGLGHAVYGGVFPKVNEVTDELQRTGALLPAMTHFGPGAPCGLARYEGFALGREYHDNLFACLFNLHKVTRHVLEPVGATFRTRDSDLLASSSTDFHPTGVIEDADGSLLVIDTGGWYKLCCPTSQLAKPDVLGAIYRIKRKGLHEMTESAREPLPAWGGHPVQLAVNLTDPRPAVVRAAIDRLGRMGPMAIRAITEGLPEWPVPHIRKNILWTLARMEAEDAREVIRGDLAAEDAGVRQTAAKICGLQRDRQAVPALLPMLQQAKQTPHLARVAAEALGRIGDRRGVPALLQSAPGPADRFLEHAFIYALIEIANPAETSAGLSSPRAETKRAALIALNEMDGRPLKAELVTPLLSSPDALLKETATWIVSRHSDWGAALGTYFQERLHAPALSEAEREELQTLLAQSARDPQVQQLIAQAAEAGSSVAFAAMARADLKTVPPSWSGAVATRLSAKDAAMLPQALAAARALSTRKDAIAPLTPALLELARDGRAGAEARLEALAILPAAAVPVDEALFGFLQGELRAEATARRANAAAQLARLKLPSKQRQALAGMVKELGPMELAKLLPAFENGPDEPTARTLLANLSAAPALQALAPQTVRAALAKFPDNLRADADALLAKVQVDAGAQRAKLEAIAVELPTGDIRAGQAIFNSPKAGCITCHAMGYLGGKIGPDLTSIGKVRTERDLLEAIVFPSASFVRSYEPMVVRTKKGEEWMGIVRGETADGVTLTAGPGAEMRFTRADIAEMRPGSVSLMPQGFDQVLTRKELADVIAFLKGEKK